MRAISVLLVGGSLFASATAFAQIQVCNGDTPGPYHLWNCACPQPNSPSVPCTTTTTTCSNAYRGAVVSVACADGGISNTMQCNYDSQYFFPYATYQPINVCTVPGGSAGGGACAAIGNNFFFQAGTSTLYGPASSCRPDPQQFPWALDVLTSPGGPGQYENQLGIGALASHDSHVDVRFNSSLGRLEMDRRYVAGSQNGSLYLTLNGTSDSFLPKPFGSTPTTSTSMNWTTNLYSFVNPQSWQPASMGWYVRTMDGELLEYQACLPLADGGFPYASSCSAQPNPSAATTTSQLVWNGGPTDAGSFTLIEATGTRYVYNTLWVGADAGTPHYFLTQVQDVAYATPGTSRVTTLVNYATPTALACPGESPTAISCPGTSSSGAPYISNVQTIEGAQLNFHYKPLPAYHGAVAHECVIDCVTVTDRASSTELPWVTYTYYTDGGAESEGLLAQVTWDAGRFDSYTYPVGGGTKYSYSSLGTQLVSAPWNSTLQSTAVNDIHEDAGLSTGSASCGTDYSSTYCFDAGTRTLTYDLRYAGNAVNALVSYSRQFLDESTNFSTGVRTHQHTDTCNATTCGAGVAGTRDFEWTRVGFQGPTVSGQAADKAVQDQNGNWTASSVAQPSNGLPPQETELQASYVGATDYNGTNALEPTSFSYAYGVNLEQLPNTVSQPSTISSGNNAVTQYTYDAGTDYLTSIIKHGWTNGFNGTNIWSTTDQYIGTFYFQNQPCTGGSAETRGRTLEVHGPCFVQGLTSTDCDINDGGVIPIKQFNYWGSGNGNATNQLHTVVEYINNNGTSCSGASSLTTTYNSYDPLGNATSVTDESGATTTYTYQEQLITSKTVGGNTTNYTYDNRKLTSIQYPSAVANPSSGLTEVFCYRTGTTPGGGCTQSAGTWTDRLQWKAKRTSTSASSWTEAVVYVYWGDGTLKSETYERNNSGSAEERKYIQHSADAKLHPTYQQWGDATGSYATARGFDPVGNQTGAGIPYNPEADWCLTSGAASTYCAQLKYSRADRLAQIDQYLSPTGSGGTDVRTCIDHDQQGNVIKVSRACSSTDACAINDAGSGTTSCGVVGSAMTYVTDDFGLLVSATLPWTARPIGIGQPGTTNFKYDARGDVIIKQTPQMNQFSEYMQYTTDNLGRILSAIDNSGGTQTTLYTLGYDSANGPFTGCPAATYNNGRLARRFDNFGNTFYSYDAQGRVLAEIRLRSGGSCSGNFYGEPHTYYTYSVDGVLTSVREPYQRGGGGTTPSWTYTLGADDRPTTVSLALYDGTNWSTSNIITNAVWEPYGGLRGYQVNTADGGSAAVEYLLGDNGSTYPGNGSSPPANCGFALASNSTGSDHTGRLRTLAVSSGTFSPGTATGNIYKLGYQWAADQVQETDTCLLDGGTPRTEQYLYDGMLRITDAGRPVGNFASAGGAFGASSNTFMSWDGRTNVSGLTNDAAPWTFSYDSDYPDKLLSATVNNGSNTLAYTYAYDKDGRVTNKFWPLDSSGTASWTLGMTYGLSTQTSSDSVFKAIAVGPAGNTVTNNYYIDALGRRREKINPALEIDEYFHDGSNRLILDTGNNTAALSNKYPVENYVWLGARPVAVVRGQFNTGFAAANRISDWTTNCTRVGDGSTCGVYYPVTDHIGKVVVILDSARRIAMEADYNPFGNPNRVSLDGETAHPYTHTNSTILLATATQPPVSPSLTVAMRAILPLNDTKSVSLCPSDHVEIDDANGGAVLWTGSSGLHAGKIVSSWVVPSQASTAASMKINFDDHNYTTWQCTPSCSCQAATAPSTYGAIVDAYEYRRYQTGATPYALPIRFAGQYYDDWETDLADNGHRYYDPTIGRYLGPDPRLSSPEAFIKKAARGLGPGPYTYAGGNPLAFSDPDGLDIVGALAAGTATAAPVETLSIPALVCGPGAPECEAVVQLAAGIAFVGGFLIYEFQHEIGDFFSSVGNAIANALSSFFGLFASNRNNLTCTNCQGSAPPSSGRQSIEAHVGGYNPATGEVGRTADNTVGGANANQASGYPQPPPSKDRCLNACAAGTVVINAFCRALEQYYYSSEDQAMCWKVSLGSRNACNGMCNAIFGD